MNINSIGTEAWGSIQVDKWALRRQVISRMFTAVDSLGVNEVTQTECVKKRRKRPEDEAMYSYICTSADGKHLRD